MSSFPFTVITALYDLKKRELSMNRRDCLFYLEHGKFLLELPVDIILFCDSHLVESIRNLADEVRPAGTRLEIISVDLEDLEFYRDLSKITELRAKGSLINANPNKDTPLFTIVQWSKFDLLSRSTNIITMYKWPERHLLWLDFGLHYIAKDFGKILAFKPTDRMKLLCLRPTYKEEVNNPTFLRFINGRTGGGVLSIPFKDVDYYVDLFRNTKDYLLGFDFSPLEDEILTYIRVNNPDLFDLYYGDYENIVHNFNDECWSSAGILNLAFQSCLQFKDFKTITILGDQIFNNRMKLKELLGDATLGQLLSTYLALEISKAGMGDSSGIDGEERKKLKRISKFIKSLT